VIANVSAHRRANAFARALEERSTRGTAPERPEEPAERPERTRMLALASSLTEVPRPELSADVKAVQRAHLLAAMETMVREGRAPTQGEAADPVVPEQRTHRGRGTHRAGSLRGLKPRSRWSKGLAAGGLTIGVAAGTLSGVAAASSDALPGDSLYGLKRGMEDVKLGMADSDSDRGEIYLDQASTRLNEARRLMERLRSGPLDDESVTEVRRALSGMGHDASEGRRLLVEAYQRGGSLAPIQSLSSFSQSHRDSWTTLREQLPHQLRDVRDQVTSVLDAIDQEVDPLRPLLPPAAPQRPGSAQSHSAPGTGRPSDLTDPAPSASGGTPTGGGLTGSPWPSAPGTSNGIGGLLGGDPDDFFSPPLQDMNPPSPSAKGGRTSQLPEHDITMPPLLPGFVADEVDGHPQEDDDDR
jgi:hypothetical protein